ncbi:MAG: hypothetical protein A2Z03_05040 [Chloroflexi bacterium RBG_16_56_8]|nr:MAG: hypothetical protein A2Z03_05040 [Chloroflexi bacterium RBG_16_56_8]
MEKLKAQLEELLTRLENATELRAKVKELVSIYPFSEYEYIISHLLASKKLSLDEYYQLRNDYLDRNLYLYLFEISAPRGFGELWAHGHLKELVPSLQRPSKQTDPNYSGEYDFFLSPNIRIEVKASRAVEFRSSAPLYLKALASDSQKQFDMNFQQIKPACCEVFVWLAVWRDVIKHWVIPSYEVENNRNYSKGQHRGNIGEGQLHLNKDNIHEFDKYLVQAKDIEAAIRAAFKREKRLRKHG